MGKGKAAAKELAPRWAPFSVAKRPEAVEKRRRELEAWLWRLIAEPRISRSRALNQFLELSDAARMVARCPSAGKCTITPYPHPIAFSACTQYNSMIQGASGGKRAETILANLQITHAEHCERCAPGPAVACAVAAAGKHGVGCVGRFRAGGGGPFALCWRRQHAGLHSYLSGLQAIYKH